jgi:hypothetical protein
MSPALFEVKDVLTAAIAAIAGIATLAKLFIDAKEAQRARDRLLEAEKDAFIGDSEERLKLLVEQKGSPAKESNQGAARENKTRTAQDQLQVGRLFDLYSKQIEKYQTETQARAGWSFVFAIFSMVSGLSFVVWGGFHILTNPGWEHVAAATGIAGIGGAVGAFITKTFLDVHRLSLSQLNHYFRQPVVNAHVLTGQRLADQITEPLMRQQAYQQLLNQVCSLIREDSSPGAVWIAPIPPTNPSSTSTDPKPSVGASAA